MFDQCPHPRTETRKKVSKNGSVYVYKQCLACGGEAENIPRKNCPALGINVNNLPDWDEEIRKRYQEARSKEWDKFHADKRGAEYDAFCKKHAEVMASARWKEIRRLVIKRCDGVCEGCGVNRVTQIHHLTYDRLGCEMLFDLRGVCDGCHDFIHNRPVASGQAKDLYYELVTRGFAFTLDGSTLYVKPSAKLTELDTRRIRENKDGLILMVTGQSF